jgi:hypothetical protein
VAIARFNPVIDKKQLVWNVLTKMRALSTGRFTREFSKLRRERLMATDRGRVVGSWTPADRKPKPLDYLERVKGYCSGPLPFTGTELLKEGKKR